MSFIRTRWAAIGAAVAVTLGGGGIAMVSATSPANAVTYVPITPCRVFDTRPDFNVGPKTSPVGPGEEHAVTATGNAGECTQVPANATAVTMNLTADGATLPTFIAVYATGAERPNSSSLNPQPGQPPIPNAVTTELSADGRFTVFNLQGSVNAFADIVGYYVDHHHDDRYYTKGQSDDRYLTPGDGDALFLTPGEAASAPRTESRWAGCIGPSMNTPDDDDNTFVISNNPRGYIGSTTNGTEFYCNLDLPQGASMSRFRALLRDIGPDGSGQGLARCFLRVMAVTGPDAGDDLTLVNTVVATGLRGTNGVETPILLEDPMGSQLVDNDNFVYSISCDLFQGGSTSVSQLGIYLAQVRYEIPIVPGTG